MGSEMEIVKDSEGGNHVIFDESSLYDDSQMGANLSDFEILQVLSDENSSFVAKVRSLNNHQIYAMKKIELNKIGNPQSRQNCIDEVEKLKELNNPHIIKYYNSFMDQKGNLYLIMEFMNNADLYGFIKAHQVLNKIIKEEEIWNILLQCISALDYLHKKNLGYSGIRFTNILMNNEQNAKIGVFYDPIKQNNQNNNYELNEDIYLLGKHFYSMTFSHHKRVKDAKSINEVSIINENNDSYSNELMFIIYKMLDLNNGIPDSNELYKTVKKEYVKKYARNTSIYAVLRCLHAFQSFNEIMLKNAILYENNIDKYYIDYWYLKAIRALSGFEEANLIECVEEFRRAIASEDSKLDGNREIDPLYLLAFLLQKMHKETNKKDSNTETSQNQNGKYVINSVFNGEEEDKTNKEQMLYKFVTYFQANVHSPISDLFFGFVKTKRNCQTCKTGNYSFHNYCFVVFDLTNRNNNEQFDIINDGFAYEYNNAKDLDPDKPERVYCERCLTYQKHVEFNRYYMMNHQLIISFIRGTNFKNESSINFNEELDLEPYVDEKKDSPKNYYLVGSINRIIDNNKIEKFIYFTRDPENDNCWHVGDELLTLNSAPINEIKNKGQIIMLFYNNKMNNLKKKPH